MAGSTHKNNNSKKSGQLIAARSEKFGGGKKGTGSGNSKSTVTFSTPVPTSASADQQPIPQSPDLKPSLKRLSSTQYLNELREETDNYIADNGALEGISVYSEAWLTQYCGYSNDFVGIWSDLYDHGIDLTIRGKAASLQNHSADGIGVPKDINIKAKTADAKSAERGVVTITDKLTSCERNPAKNAFFPDELYDVTYMDENQHKVACHATFLRQTINSIYSLILDNKYKLLEVVNDPQGKGRFIVIQDRSKEGKNNGKKQKYYDTDKYYIKLDESEWRDGIRDSYASVSSKVKRFDRQKSHKGRSEMEIDKLQSLQGLLKELGPQALGKNVRLLRYMEDTKQIIEQPHVVCDENRIPIKGDSDVQHALLPDSLPLKALALADLNTKGLIAQLTDLSREFVKEKYPATVVMTDDALDKLVKAEARKNYYVRVVLDAIHNLQSHPDVEQRVKLLGNGLLFEIAVILKTNSDVRHGSESFSPVLPENIVTTHIPHPDNHGRRIVTHNEYEYLQALHNIKSILDHKIIFFYPMVFVPCGATKWRKDLDVSDTEGLHVGAGNHPCNNLKDEVINIRLQQLLFKEHLLNYRVNNAKKFKGYLDVIRGNYRELLSSRVIIEKLGKEGVELFHKGWDVAEQIMQQVSNSNDIQSDLKAVQLEVKGLRRNDSADRRKSTTTSTAFTFKHH